MAYEWHQKLQFGSLDMSDSPTVIEPSQASFSLAGRIALITGGAGGIGVACAKRLLSAGASVAIADLNAQAALAAAGAFDSEHVAGFAADVSEAQQCGRLVTEVLRRFERIDILINNAGIMGRVAQVWELSEADWDRVMSIDLKSVFLMSRAVLPHMRQRRSGCIISVSSIAGKEGTPGLVPYSVAKAGIIGFTKAFGKEVVADGIRVNCVAPGVVATALLDQLPPDSINLMLSKVPMRRLGTVDEVAAVIHFLASDAASFITAQCLDASGGRATY